MRSRNKTVTHLGTFDARCNRRARPQRLAPDGLSAFLVFGFILAMAML